jgi:zinc and cadmium transporter
MTLLWIIGAVVSGGVLSVLAAGAISLTLLSSWVSRMLSYSVGVLLAVAFLNLLPEAFERTDSIHALFALTLAGVLSFFVLERLALWRHHHDHEGDAVSHAAGSRSGTLVLIGDGVHNFVDGVVIAATFLTDIALGVTTTLAIIAHEIPQEVGDFMVLLHSGYSKKKALIFNVLSSLMSVVGAIAGYFALDHVQGVVPYVLVLAAASFIYIAVADLIPDLHRSSDLKSSIVHILLIAAGIATILLLQQLLRHD